MRTYTFRQRSERNLHHIKAVSHTEARRRLCDRLGMSKATLTELYIFVRAEAYVSTGSCETEPSPSHIIELFSKTGSFIARTVAYNKSEAELNARLLRSGATGSIVTITKGVQ